MLQKHTVNISSKTVFNDLLADNLIRFSFYFVESQVFQISDFQTNSPSRPLSHALLVPVPATVWLVSLFHDPKGVLYLRETLHSKARWAGGTCSLFSIVGEPGAKEQHYWDRKRPAPSLMRFMNENRWMKTWKWDLKSHLCCPFWESHLYPLSMGVPAWRPQSLPIPLLFSH